MNKRLAAVMVGFVSACGVGSVAVVENDDPMAGPLADTAESEQELTISQLLPLRAGNVWTLGDGTDTRTVRVVHSSGSVHLVEGLAADGPVWLAFAGSRLWVWNVGERTWQTMVNFGSTTAQSTFSFGSSCEQYTSVRSGALQTVVTPAGTFSRARRYDFTVRPPPHVRCAMPRFAGLTFVENVGLVQWHTSTPVTFSLQRASVNGRDYPEPTAKATVTMDKAQYRLGADGAATLRATLVVKNETTRPMTFQFSSSQQFELEVQTSSGETAYFWSADKSFLAALSSFTLQPNQSRTFTETFDLQNAQPGWHLVRAWLPTRAGAKPEASAKVELLAAPAPCFVGGCSSQMCSDRPDVISTCEWRPQYACYRTATCERQATGQCGWTMTAALQQCLAR
jgi:hypothetical protein